MAGLEPESRWIKSQNNWNRKVHGKWTGFLLDWNLCVWDNFSISSRTSLQQKWTAGEVLDVYSVSVFLVSGTSPAQWSQSVSATRAACLSQNFQPGPSLQQKPPPPPPRDQYFSLGFIDHLLWAARWQTVAAYKRRYSKPGKIAE